jgi:hypothetical protein
MLLAFTMTLEMLHVGPNVMPLWWCPLSYPCYPQLCLATLMDGERMERAALERLDQMVVLKTYPLP